MKAATMTPAIKTPKVSVAEIQNYVLNVFEWNALQNEARDQLLSCKKDADKLKTRGTWTFSSLARALITKNALSYAIVTY